MAKYAKVGRFLAEDYDESDSWFKDRFLRMLNKFKDQIESFVDKGMTVNDNMQGGIYELTLSIGASVDAALPLSFKTGAKPRIVVCGSCIDATTSEVPALAPRLAWTYADGVVNITGIDGLSANKVYKLQILALVN